MSKKIKKEITIQDLAVAIDRGFKAVDKRFISVDKRLDTVDKRLDSMDSRFGSVEKRLGVVESGLEGVRKTVLLQQKIFVTNEDFADFRDEIMGQFSELQSAVDNYASKADGYFQEMVLLSHKVDRHEKWLHLMADKLGVKLEY